MKNLHVVPAYGRDYTSAKALKAAWEAGCDFLICNVFDPYDGKPVNLEDALGGGYTTVTARFAGLRKVTSFKVVATKAVPQ